MRIESALRLTGFLATHGSSPAEVADALKRARSRCGLRDDASEPEIARELAGILARRGFTNAPDRTTSRTEGERLAAGADGDRDAHFDLCGVIRCNSMSDGIQVEVLDARPGGNRGKVLGACPATPHGEICVSFTTQDPGVIKARFRSGDNVLHTTGPIRLGRDLWVEWSDSIEPVPRAGRFEISRALLEHRMGGESQSAVRLSDLREADDLDSLATLTGLPIAEVRKHSLADRVASALKISEPAAFALLSAPGLAEELRSKSSSDDELEVARRAIARRLPADSIADVERAAAAGDIAHLGQRGLDELGKHLKVGHLEHWGKEPMRGGTSPWSAVLEAVGFRHDEAPIALASLVAHGDDAWTSIEESLGDKERAAGLRQAVGVAALTNYSASATAAILDAGVRSPRALALLDEKICIEALRSREGNEGAVAMAREIANTADVQFPGEALIRRRRDRTSAPTRAFLESRGERFNLLTDDVDNLARQRQLHDDPAENAKVRAELSTLQRVVFLAPHGSQAAALLERSYDSAQKIAVTHPRRFSADLDGVVSREQADSLHRIARKRYRAVQDLYLRVNRQANGPALRVLAPQFRNESGQGIPTYEALFGSPDYVEIKDCESVVGPAAYLVDLLVWLRSLPGKSARNETAFETLVRRRPDVKSVLLNCRNTDTLVPHLDLITEALESRAGERLAIATPGPKQRQTTKTAEEIRAYPEYVSEKIYSALEAIYGALGAAFDLPAAATRASFNLPLDLSATEKRMYLSAAGTSLVALLAAFSPDDAAARAAEHFGIGRREMEIIEKSAATEALQAKVWDIESVDSISVAALLRVLPSKPKGPLGYYDLPPLLFNDFVDPSRAIAIYAPNGDSNDADERKFINLDQTILDRLHRFARLSRRVPWPPRVLGRLVAALGPNASLGSKLVEHLHAVAQLESRLKLDPNVITCLFRKFNAEDLPIEMRMTPPEPSLYRQLFLTRPNPPAAYSGNGPALKITDDASFLCGALRVDVGSFDSLLDASGQKDADVSFESLWALLRWATLGKALALPFNDVKALATIVGDPFKSPTDLLTLVDATTTIAAVGLTVADLQELQRKADSPLVFPDEIQKALARAIDDNKPFITDIKTGKWASVAAVALGFDTRAARLLQMLPENESKPEDLMKPSSAPEWQAAARRLYRTLRIADVLGELQPVLRLIERMWSDDPKRPRIAPAWLKDFWSLAKAEQPTWSGVDDCLQWPALRKSAVNTNALDAYFIGLDALPDDKLVELYGIAFARDPKVIAEYWQIEKPADPRRARYHRSFGEQLDLFARLRLPPSELRKLGTASSAASLRDAIRARSSREEWLSLSRNVQDSLRELRRNALVAYLCTITSAEEPSTPEELSAEILMDVSMGVGRDTSRIVEASSAVQTFVQRCLLGLEDPAFTGSADGSLWDDWPWRKRYQLWRANRLIFLFPENFLHTGSRATASPLFRAMRKDLAQGPITDEQVAVALDRYLEGLDEISNLEYLATCESSEGSSGPLTLSFLARTRGGDRKYFFRSLRKKRWWPWQEVTISNASSHFSLSESGERHWLVWPVFVEQSNPDTQPPAIQADKNPPAKAPGITYLKFAWRVRDRAGDWSPVAVTSRALVFSQRNARRIGFSSVVKDGRLKVSVIGPPAASGDQSLVALGEMEIGRDVFRVAMNTSVRGLSSLATSEHGSELAYIGSVDEGVGIQHPAGLTLDENHLVRFAFGQGSKPLMMAPRLNAPFQKLISPPVRVEVLPASVRETGLIGRCAISASDWSMLALGKEFAIDRIVYEPREAELLSLFPLYHAFTGELLQLNRTLGPSALFTWATQSDPRSFGATPRSYARSVCGAGDTINGQFTPFEHVGFPSPYESIDFDAWSPYALYNFELFFFTPVTVAEDLMTAGKFQEAQRYFHYVFNPLTLEAAGPEHPTARYWITKPFRLNQSATEDLADHVKKLIKAGEDPFEPIIADPFDPHAVAERRPVAYQKHTVMRYLDNLIAWGDSFFRAKTREDIIEAWTIYSLAKAILGDTPVRLPPYRAPKELSFEDHPEGWVGGNILAELEPLIRSPLDDKPEGASEQPVVHLPLENDSDAGSLYFRIPYNEKLVKYWADVEQRLDNIRYSRALDGTSLGNLPLLAAPIDPQALADAAAKGVSVADVVASLSAPVPPQRFRFMMSRAQEACGEVRSLGAALLTALEKVDGELLARLRSTYEKRILDRARDGKQAQRTQTEAEVAALRQARETIIARREHFRSQKFMNDQESAAFEMSSLSRDLDLASLVLDAIASTMFVIPDFTFGVEGMGGTPTMTTSIGGTTIGKAIEAVSRAASRTAGNLDRTASLALTQGNYIRRQEEWTFNGDQADLELTHLDKQIAAAGLRLAIVDADLKGQEAQEQSWHATDRLLREKFTNTELHGWMADRLNALYRVAYEGALKLARQAAACFDFEREPNNKAQDKFSSQWDASKQGLLAGEELARALRELDARYASERPYERLVTHHVSLKSISLTELHKLKSSGTRSATFKVPAWWWRLTYPGLKRRRVRSLAVSIPCIGGPNASVNATVEVNTPPGILGKISLSSGLNDTGWDESLLTESYGPFEGTSLQEETSWTIGFPANSDIDGNSIVDVILHVQYTADSETEPAESREFTFATDLGEADPESFRALTRGMKATVDFTAIRPRALSTFAIKGNKVDVIAYDENNGPLEKESFDVGNDGAAAISLKPSPGKTIARVVVEAKLDVQLTV